MVVVEAEVEVEAVVAGEEAVDEVAAVVGRGKWETLVVAVEGRDVAEGWDMGS